MGLFTRKTKMPTQAQQDTTQRHIEISVAKDASQEMFDKTKKATDYLNEVLQENHIHIKIYSAVGGKNKKKGA